MIVFGNFIDKWLIYAIAFGAVYYLFFAKRKSRNAGNGNINNGSSMNYNNMSNMNNANRMPNNYVPPINTMPNNLPRNNNNFPPNIGR